MKRRRLLAGVPLGITAVSGCASSGEDDIQDSDGDGVIDSQDYAPSDPEVQEKSDVQGTTATITREPTASATPTASPTPEPTPTATQTPTASPTEEPPSESNRLDVTDDYWQETSHVAWYSDSQLEVVVVPEYPSIDHDRVRVFAGLYDFEGETTFSESLSDAFDRSSGDHTVRIDHGEWDRDEVSPGEQLRHVVGLVPANKSSSELSLSDLALIMESDPWEYTSPEKIERADLDILLNDASGQNYERNSVEGSYVLTIDGRTNGSSWTVSYTTYKSGHARRSKKSRGKGYSGFVDYELTSGNATGFSRLLAEDAEALGFSGRTAIEFVIDFVQALPYVPDDVSTGYDDYPKYVLETVCELGGDCEDTAILLASLLEADGFGYDMVLIQPPSHMAVGIWNENPSGYYWEHEGRKYAYVETTGAGWGVGEIPSEYEGEQAYVYQV